MKNFTVSNGGNSGGINIGSDYSPVLDSLIVSNNTAHGIALGHGGEPIIKNCIITNNGGGGVYSKYTNFTLKNSKIFSNTGENGSGVYAQECNFVIEGCSIYENSATNGGGSGIFIDTTDGGVSSIINSTIVNNSQINGNSTGVLLQNNANVRMVNSILYGHHTAEIIMGDNSNDQLNLSYSDILDGQNSVTVGNGSLTWGSGNINVNPMFIDTANGDYTLQMDSPLIDAGHPDSTDGDGTRTDIGAYYYDQSG